jgi:hypothetical protein
VGEAGTGLHKASLHGSNRSLVGSSVLDFASPRVGVVVYSGVTVDC